MPEIDQDLLRLILGALGVVLVVGIYLWDRYKRISRRFPKIRMDRNLKDVDFDIPERDDDVGEVRVRSSQLQDEFDPVEPALRSQEGEQPVYTTTQADIVEPILESEIQSELQATSEPEWQAQTDTEVGAETTPQEADSEPVPELESFSAIDPEPDLKGLGLKLDQAPDSTDEEPAVTLTPQDEVMPAGDDQFALDLEFDAHGEADYLNLDPDLMGEAPRLIVQINIMSKSAPFSLAQVRNAAAQVDLRYGDMQIYHRETDAGQALFSMASVVEPGTFPAGQAAHFSTPGLTLFTQLPGVREGIAIYADMLFTAERLAALLDGVLKDETRNKLTKQRIEHTREAILEHSRQLQLLRSRH